MKKQALAIIIQEGSKLVSEFLRTTIHTRVPPATFPTMEAETPLPLKVSSLSVTPEKEPEENRATSIKSGCVPCSIGHVGVCSGLLKEAVRFARDEGVTSDAVLERTGICLDELNSMERVDMSPAMLKGLPPEERELADRVLSTSRNTRHAIESLSTPGVTIAELEDIAADLEITRKDIWRDFVKIRTAGSDLTPEQMEKVQETVLEKVEELNQSE